MGWRDGLVVKNMYCSCVEPEFDSQYLCQEVYFTTAHNSGFWDSNILFSPLEKLFYF